MQLQAPKAFHDIQWIKTRRAHNCQEPSQLRKHSTIYSGFYTCGVAALRLSNARASTVAAFALRGSKTLKRHCERATRAWQSTQQPSAFLLKIFGPASTGPFLFCIAYKNVFPYTISYIHPSTHIVLILHPAIFA